MTVSINLEINSDYGSEKFVTLISAASRRALSRKVQEINPGHIDTGCGHDCSGQVCGRYAELLRAYRVGAEWIGVVCIQIHRDV